AGPLGVQILRLEISLRIRAMTVARCRVNTFGEELASLLLMYSFDALLVATPGGVALEMVV
ncbi:hypothetical protein A2U01_0026677, partial [Trifolium medium]|nr:hypothetical protein [Trifolium medium]